MISRNGLLKAVKLTKHSCWTRYPPVLVRSYTTAIQKPADSRFGDHVSHAQVTLRWRDHSIETHNLRNTFIVDTLRSAYPDHFLVSTGEDAGILTFAKAGGLSASLDRTIGFYGSRGQDENESTDKGEIILGDKIDFARFNCTWKGQDFYIYKVKMEESEYTSTHNHYILCPNDTFGGKHEQAKFVDDLIVAACKHNAVVEDQIWVYQDSYWHRSGNLWNSIQGSTWENVTLEPRMKEELMTEVSRFFDLENHYASFGVPWRRGLIFHGLPGNGKTVTIKAIIGAIGQRSRPIPTLYVKSLDGMASASDIRSIFSKARETSPCLLVCEDLDGLVQQSVRSLFLNEIDGLQRNNGILFIGTTNYLDQLDVAITKRPSRFDRKYHFPLPGIAERTLYCDSWRDKMFRDASVEIDPELSRKIAELTEGLSFAYLQEIYISAMTSILTDKQSSETLDAATGTWPAVTSDMVWRAVNKQIQNIRQELTDSKKSVDDANKNTAVGDAKSSTGQTTGFGR